MISLVTACMNREAHLRQALPAWLALPGVAEIVIVDWSNPTPLSELCALDSRVRVIRAEGESRWMLSYAYNLGIDHARHHTILKCDADCIPSAAVTRLQPTPTQFYTGDWRSGKALGKLSVNGQCLFTREQFDKVNGYSEFLRDYGHDDADFYERLSNAGYERSEIAPTELAFIDHSLHDRLAHQQAANSPDPLESFIQQQVFYFEMYNLALANMLPWGNWQARARYDNVAEGNWRRDKTREIPITTPIQALARLHALRALSSRICGLPAAQVRSMDQLACLAALRQKLL